MNDVCSGGHSLLEVIAKVKQTYEMFGLGCYPLRKWISNRPEVLQSLPQKVLASEPFTLRDASSSTSILGLFWRPADDAFFYEVEKLEPLTKITKRTVLSRIARIFDPLGWVARVVVLAKMLMRELWISKTGWVGMSQSIPNAYDFGQIGTFS